VGLYRQLAYQAIVDIQARGKVAIVCGGTGLYFRALRHGLVSMPPKNPALRTELNARSNEDLWKELATIDSESARTIDKNNKVHLLRSLEIFHLTGIPASTLRREHAFKCDEVPMRAMVIDRPDSALQDRIQKRCDSMLASGLLDEVDNLLKQGVSVT